MDKLLLVGAGGFGRVVLEHTIQEYECAFIDDADIKEINGIPVIGRIDDIERLHVEYKKLIVTIGNNKMRAKIYKEAARIGYEFPNIIVSSVYISPFATMGSGCIFLNNVVVQNNVRVGNGVILNPGVELHHDSIIDDNVLIYTNTVVRSLARVGSRAYLGSTLTIGNEVIIEEDSIIMDGMSIQKGDMI